MRKPGDKVPAVTFQVRKNGEWVEWTSEQLFGGKTVIVFALPGAFTPTCSSTHLPGYVAMADKLSAIGVDAVYCLSVNDSFVMNAWAKDQGIDDEVIMLPDGNGDFSEGMGLLVEKRNLGFGKRSWRYAMLVVDGTIEKMFVEDMNQPGDPFEVSDVGTMMAYLNGRNQVAAE